MLWKRRKDKRKESLDLHIFNLQLRFEKMLDGRVRRTPSTSQDATDSDVPQKPTQQPDTQQPASSALSRDTVKEKTKSLTSSIAGVFTKLNKKDNKKKVRSNCF